MALSTRLNSSSSWFPRAFQVGSKPSDHIATSVTRDTLQFPSDVQGEAQKGDQSHYHHGQLETTTVSETNSGPLLGKARDV